jgi:hypothetical protein
MNKRHHPGDVFRQTLGPIVAESIGVISGKLLRSQGASIKVLRHGGFEVACAGLQDLDDVVPASQGLSGLARE